MSSVLPSFHDLIITPPFSQADVPTRPFKIGPLCLLELWGLYGVGTTRAYEAQRKVLNAKMDLEHLDLMMALLEIIHLVFRPTISDIQLATAEAKIKTFTESACRLHHGVTGIWNLHWLSHLPTDIRNFGPVYSFWCFASERFNKTLKNIKLNGHVRQIPMTLMRVFQNYAHLRELSGFGYQEGVVEMDAVNQIAKSLRDVYDRFNRETQGTSEQKWAEEWEQEGELGQGGKAGACAVEVDVGRSTALDRLRTAKLQNHLEVNTPWVKATDAEWRFIRENDDARGKEPSITFVVTSRITCYRRMSIGRRKFASFIGAINDDHLSGSEIIACKDSLVEIRDPDRVYRLQYDRAPVGVIVNIFSQELTSLDKRTRFASTYMVVVYLSPYAYSESAPYQFRRYPCFNIWPWHAGDVGPEALIRIDHKVSSTLLPVSLKPMLKSPNTRSNDKIWVTMDMRHLE